MEDRDASQQSISPNSGTTISMIATLEMASKENGQGEKVVPKKKRPNEAERLSLEPSLNLEEGKLQLRRELISPARTPTMMLTN
ncbi:hypothetical protein SNEBB_003678 [Seison nebaliae]|nr:hypothetical protein SNEBB_003678 [Seison nebaliae]